MSFSIYLFFHLSLLSFLLLVINITSNKTNINNSICTDITTIIHGAASSELSAQPQRILPDNNTTSSRILAVICPHLGNKVDTHKRPHHTTITHFTTASDGILLSEAATERPGLAPRSAGQRQSVPLTLDTVRRKGLPQTYEAFGRIQPMKPSRGQRSRDTKINITTHKPERT